MRNTEIKVGDLVTWAHGKSDHRGLVVRAETETTTGLHIPAHHRVYWVRWLSGPRRGDTLDPFAESILVLLSDLKNKKRNRLTCDEE